MVKAATKATASAIAAIPGDFVQNPTIYLVDQRSASAGAGPAVDAVGEALREQLTNDFIPIWGSAFGGSATILTTGTPRPSDFVLYIVDQSSFGLGYHNYDPNRTNPFYGEITGSGDYWSITASHEVLEILINPYTSNCYGGYRLEVGDPVEDLSYAIGNVYVSDFAFPAWWGIASGPSTQFDLLKKAPAAGDITYGYIQTCTAVAGGAMTIGIKTREPGTCPVPSIIRGTAHPLAIAMLGRQAIASWRTPAAYGYIVTRKS